MPVSVYLYNKNLIVNRTLSTLSISTSARIVTYNIIVFEMIPSCWSLLESNCYTSMLVDIMHGFA